jgi:single-strand DNA-binding protein
MAGVNINRVIITGNLTRDPELRSTNAGLSICKLGIAVNGRRKNPSTGDWEDKPNFFRVTVFGTQADRCNEYLRKGRPVAIDGRLEWSQYEREGQKIESIDIIADSVQFLGSREDSGSSNGNGFSSSVRAAESDVPIDSGDFQPAAVSPGAADDDIPF